MDRDVSQASEDRQRLEDAALIRAVRDNRVEAIQQFGHRLKCVPRILTVQNVRMGSPLGREDLADVTQESLIVIWRKLQQFDPNTLFESWAYRICFLELMNHLRKMRRRRRLFGEVAEHLLAEEQTGSVSLSETELYEVVHLALEILDDDESAIIRMRHFEERTFQEVGARLRIPVGTAKTRYYRGLTKLRDYVRNHNEEGHLGHAVQG